MTDLAAAAGPIGALSDDLRRRMYLFIRAARRPVSRDEAAAEVGISRKLAAFHLDKLVELGLLVAQYGRPPGRSATLAGRSAKMYEPSDIELDVSVPQRRYDRAGKMLVEAIDQAGPAESPRDAAVRIAEQHGTCLGERVRQEKGLRPLGAERTLATASKVLEDEGYEPYPAGPDAVALRNCPFHDLASDAPDLVCNMNRSFIEGLVRGLGNESVDALLTPRPGECCVTLSAKQKETR